MTPTELVREQAEKARIVDKWKAANGYDDLLAAYSTAVDEVRATEAALAETRYAALMAAGVRGGPHAWRWEQDPTGTTLDDEAAWARLLGEMRAEMARPCAISAKPCARHGYAHGQEAEELRAGVEKILGNSNKVAPVAELQRLLDKTDARDSLAYLEAKARNRAQNFKGGRRG